MTVSRNGLTVMLAMLAALTAAGWLGCGGNKDTPPPKKPEQGAAVSKKADTLRPEKSEPAAVSVEYGELSDDRDGQKYRTVKIGDQVWMADNLNYQTDKSWCYEDDESKCQQYGRLYAWSAAAASCPKGWHLPSKDEWAKLVAATESAGASKRLKSKSGWGDYGGTDVYGFSALPGGLRGIFGGFSWGGLMGDWWTATDTGDAAYSRSLDHLGRVLDESRINKISGFSVRCLED